MTDVSAGLLRPEYAERNASSRTHSPLDVLSSTANVAGTVLLTAVVVAAQHEVDPRVTSLLFAAATLAVLVGAIFSRRVGGLTLIIAYFFFVFVAVPAVFQIRRDTFPFGGSYTPKQLNDGLLAMALGLLSFFVGAAVAYARRGPGQDAKPNDELGTETATGIGRPVRLALRMSLTFTAVAAVLGALAGPETLFTARADATADITKGSQGLHIARSFALVALLLCLIAIRRSRGRRSRQVAWACLVPVAGVAGVVNFPPALPRFQLLGIVLAVLVLLVDFHRPVVKVVFTFSATFFLLYGFAAVKDLRSGALSDALTPGGLIDSDPGQYLLGVDFDAYKQTVDTLMYFSQASPRWGANFLGVLLFWVPRSLWPGKPVHTGQIVSEGLGYWYTNVSNPLPAEGFASWGFTGVIVVLLALGMIVMKLERATFSSDARGTPQLVTYAVSVGYSTILLRGALNAVAPMIGTAFVLALVVHLVYRHRRSRNEGPLSDSSIAPTGATASEFLN